MTKNQEKLKEICIDVIKKECEEQGLDVKPNILTIQEFYKRFTLKNHKAFPSYMPKRYDGFYYSKTKELFIFVNCPSNKIQDKERRKGLYTDRTIGELVYLCYHELRHVKQKESDYTTYDDFIMAIDSLITNYNSGSFYDENHDFLAYEIDAEMYKHKKAKEYLETNYPEELVNLREEAEYDLDFHTFYLNMHDPVSRLDECYRLLASNCLKQPLDPIERTIISLMNSNIEELIQKVNMMNLDSRIIPVVMTTDYFMNNLEFSELNPENIEILKQNLVFLIESYEQKIQIASDYYKRDMITKERYLRVIETLGDILKRKYEILKELEAIRQLKLKKE